MRYLLLLVLVMVMVNCSGTAYAAVNVYPITIGREPGTSADNISLELDGDQARVPLFLTYHGNVPVIGLRLFVVLREGSQMSPRGMIRFFDSDAGDVPLGRFDMAPSVGSRMVELVLEGIALTRPATGFIGLEVNGSNVRLAELVVNPSSRPVLRVLESDDQGTITLVAHSPQLSASVLLEDTALRDGDTQIQLTASSLRDTNNREMVLTLNPATLTLTPGVPQPVNITGTLPAFAEFRGALVIKYGEQSKTYVLVVRREQSLDSFSLRVSPPSPITIWPFFWDSSDSVIYLTLTEQNGSQVQVYPPVLDEIVRVDQQGERGSDFQGWDVQDSRDVTLSRDQPFTLASNQPTQLKLNVRHIKGAGQHRGTLTVRTPGGVERQVTFSIYTKHHWFPLVLTILAAALLSYWLRRWLEFDRPMLLKLRKARSIVSRAHTIIRDEDIKLRRTFEMHLSEVAETAIVDSSFDLDGELERTAKQLEDYLRIRSTLALRPTLDRMIVGTDERRVVTQKLDVFQLTFQQLGEDLEELSTLAAEAASLNQMIVQLANKSLEHAIKQLRAAIDQDYNVEQDEAIREELKRINNQLVPVTDDGSIDARPVADIEAIVEVYNLAQMQYLDLSVRRFRTMLASEDDVEGTFSEGWGEFKQRVLALLPPKATFAQYNQARKTYLKGVLNALHDLAVHKVSLTRGQSEHTEQFQEIVKGCNEALELLENDMDAAQRRYQELRNRYRQLARRRGSAFESIPSPEDEEAVDASLAHPVPSFPQPPQASVAALTQASKDIAVRIPSMKAIRSQVTLKDILAFIIVTAVSIVLGLEVLYVSKATFGTLSDYLTAFLWGFGLQELNKLLSPTTAKLGLDALPALRTQERGTTPTDPT